MSNEKATPDIPNFERRSIALEANELRAEDRADGQGYLIHGYAAVFNRLSGDLGGWKEKLLPGCFDRCMGSSDIRALVNHDPNLILGRNTSGTLRLSSDSHGLRAEIDTPNTALARHYVEAIRRGDMSGMSFAFTMAGDGDSWEQNGDLYVRSIKEIGRLFDVGPVTYPAYEDTRVAVRCLAAARASHATPPIPISENMRDYIRANESLKRRLDLAWRWNTV